MQEFKATPLTPVCRQRLEGCRHVCVGISPFNGYFNADRIAELVAWARTTYPHSHFFVPDSSPAWTFMALGYDERKAHHKARRQGQYVVNKVKTGLSAVGETSPEDYVITVSSLQATNARYRELAAEARRRFDTEPDFREAVLTTSGWVLQGYLPAGQTPTLEQSELAAQYFLDELPLFIDTPGMVGVESSTFVYHQRVPFLQRLYSGELSWHADPGQSFTVLEAVAAA